MPSGWFRMFCDQVVHFQLPSLRYFCVVYDVNRTSVSNIFLMHFYSEWSVPHLEEISLNAAIPPFLPPTITTLTINLDMVEDTARLCDALLSISSLHTLRLKLRGRQGGILYLHVAPQRNIPNVTCLELEWEVGMPPIAWRLKDASNLRLGISFSKVTTLSVTLTEKVCIPTLADEGWREQLTVLDFLFPVDRPSIVPSLEKLAIHAKDPELSSLTKWTLPFHKFPFLRHLSIDASRLQIFSPRKEAYTKGLPLLQTIKLIECHSIITESLVIFLEHLQQAALAKGQPNNMAHLEVIRCKALRRDALSILLEDKLHWVACCEEDSV